MTDSRQRSAGLVLDPWRFDPSAAAEAANEVIRADAGAPALLHRWLVEGDDPHAATAALLVARLVLTPVPPLGAGDTLRPDAPALPHHPFIVSDGLPFLPTGAFESGGANLAPGDAIDALFGKATRRSAPYEPDADPIAAAIELLASDAWRSTILPDAEPLASRRVRWQAVRALGRPDWLAGLDPVSAEQPAFEAGWRKCVAQSQPR